MTLLKVTYFLQCAKQQEDFKTWILLVAIVFDEHIHTVGLHFYTKTSFNSL